MLRACMANWRGAYDWTWSSPDGCTKQFSISVNATWMKRLFWKENCKEMENYVLSTRFHWQFTCPRFICNLLALHATIKLVGFIVAVVWKSRHHVLTHCGTVVGFPVSSEARIWKKIYTHSFSWASHFQGVAWNPANPCIQVLPIGFGLMSVATQSPWMHHWKRTMLDRVLI